MSFTATPNPGEMAPAERIGGRVNVPRIPAGTPRRGNPLVQRIMIALLRLTGWRFAGADFPDVPRMVLIVAPHTSNWDFPLGVMAMFALRIRGTYLGKHTLFRFPLGILMRYLGGIAVDRGSSQDVVGQTVAIAQGMDRAIIVLAPEGTRKLAPKWKTGFYRIAQQGGMPIFPVAFDYARKEIRFFPPFHPTGDLEADLAALRANFTPQMARYPAQYA
ncbi:MAG: lysophospholipid acyltransferase family protein [Gemmatimonadetes bacterium]|jgi:1-acyl-sn-glycerol-3-phosphate acyltransferase|nr:lysophospholipid acyltransferase family protein [Gemmatimonadota bacterium]